MAEAVKKEEEKKKFPIGKLKELSEDKEEQMAILSTFVRLGILIWIRWNFNFELCYISRNDRAG